MRSCDADMHVRKMPEETKVPEQDGASLCEPSLAQWRSMAESNAALRQGWSVRVAGVPVQRLAAQVRQECLGLAEAYTAWVDRLGGAAAAASPATLEPPLIVSGHQPGFPHAGVGWKYLVLEKAARHQGLPALNLVVDNDATQQAGLNWPVWERFWQVRTVALGVSDQSRPWEGWPLPSSEQWERFCRSLPLEGGDSRLPETARLPENSRRAWEEFAALAAGLLKRCAGAAGEWSDGVSSPPVWAEGPSGPAPPQLPSRPGLATWLTAVRRAWERRIWQGPLHYLELPVSWQSRSRGFLLFFLELVQGRHRFVQIYNEELARYRKEHHLRYAANPFPDLTTGPGLWELPFWWVPEGGNRRYRLYVWENPAAGPRGGLCLCRGGEEAGAEAGEAPEAGEEPAGGRVAAGGAAAGKKGELGAAVSDGTYSGPTFLGSADPGPVILVLPALEPEALADWLQSALAQAGWGIRPRALTLTLFNRLLVGDLFLHGVGGAHYDRMTDALFSRYFGVTPPSYAVASLTLHLPLPWEGPAPEELARMEHTLRDWVQNPDRHLDSLPPGALGPEEDAAVRRLVEEKKRLLAIVQQPGADRKTVGLQIKAINRELAALLAPWLKTQEEELERQKQQADVWHALRFREYPLFLHGEERLRRLLT